jgi:hypothetical protein
VVESCEIVKTWKFLEKGFSVVVGIYFHEWEQVAIEGDKEKKIVNCMLSKVFSWSFFIQEYNRLWGSP